MKPIADLSKTEHVIARHKLFTTTIEDLLCLEEPDFEDGSDEEYEPELCLVALDEDNNYIKDSDGNIIAITEIDNISVTDIMNNYSACSRYEKIYNKIVEAITERDDEEEED